jgi:hypothetical protein
VAVFGCVALVVVPETVCEKLVELDEVSLAEDDTLLDEDSLEDEDSLLEDELVSAGPHTMTWLI